METKSNVSKWRVIGLNSKQVNALRELQRSQAKAILCKKYRKEYLEILRKIRQDYIDKERETLNI